MWVSPKPHDDFRSVLCIAMGEIGVLPLFPITVLLHAGFIGFFSNVRSDRLLAELRHSPWKEVARVGCQLNASTSEFPFFFPFLVGCSPHAAAQLQLMATFMCLLFWDNIKCIFILLYPSLIWI